MWVLRNPVKLRIMTEKSRAEQLVQQVINQPKANRIGNSWSFYETDGVSKAYVKFGNYAPVVVNIVDTQITPLLGYLLTQEPVELFTDELKQGNPVSDFRAVMLEQLMKAAPQSLKVYPYCKDESCVEVKAKMLSTTFKFYIKLDSAIADKLRMKHILL